MDPRQKSNFDPKLKAAYDSVMGIQTSSSENQKKVPSPSPIPTPQIFKPLVSKPTPPTPQIITSPIASSQNSNPLLKSIPVKHYESFVADDLKTKNKHEGTNKKRNFLIILGVFILISLLAGYLIFWAKVFNITLPFL